MPSDTYVIEDDPFYITRGDDFVVTVDFSGEDVSLNTYAAHVRVEPEAAEFLSFAVEAGNAALGYVNIRLSPTQTRSMTDDRYVFDFQETDVNGVVETIFRGNIRMREDVTK